MRTRARIQRAARGAVMVEAVIVITFFVLCFFGVVYFRTLYLEKLQLQRLARASALAHAMGACRSDPRAVVAADLGPRRLEDQRASGLPFDVVPTPSGNPGSVGLQRIRDKNGDTGFDAVTTVTVAGEARAVGRSDPNSPERGFRSDVSSASSVVCADPTPDDRYAGMVDTIASLF